MEKPFMFSQISKLTYCTVRITFKALEPIQLPEYKGSTFRGAFGNALRKEVCEFPGHLCESCRLQETCLRTFMFPVSPQANNKHTRFGTPPRPYIISPFDDKRISYQPEDTFGFDLILIGSAIYKIIPILLTVVHKMGTGGFGRNFGKAEAISMLCLSESGEFKPLNAIGLPPMDTITFHQNENLSESLVLEFITPVRIRKEGTVLNHPPEFDEFTRRLAIRFSLISHLYCNAEWVEVYDSPIISEVRIAEHNLQWVDWQRYSGTQKSTMKFDGFKGQIKYTGNISQWLPLVCAGEVLHAGSTATFGLGKYRIILNE